MFSVLFCYIIELCLVKYACSFHSGVKTTLISIPNRQNRCAVSQQLGNGGRGTGMAGTVGCWVGCAVSWQPGTGWGCSGDSGEGGRAGLPGICIGCWSQLRGTRAAGPAVAGARGGRRFRATVRSLPRCACGERRRLRPSAGGGTGELSSPARPTSSYPRSSGVRGENQLTLFSSTTAAPGYSTAPVQMSQNPLVH